MTHLLDKFIWLLTVVLLSCFLIFHEHAFLRAILVGIVGLLAGCIFIRRNFHPKITLTRFHAGVLLFAFFCFLSSSWAPDPRAALVQGGTVLQILVTMSVLWLYYQDKPSVADLLDALRWSGYIVAIYTFLHYGMGGIREVFLAASRLKGEFANTNDISVFVTFSFILTLYKWLYYKFSWDFVFVLPCLIIVAACASRKALLMLVGGTLLLIVFRYASKNLFMTLFKMFFILLVGAVIFKGVLSLSIFDSVSHRMEGLISAVSGGESADRSSLIRMEMLRIGWEQFKQTPVLGMGLGNPYILTERYFGFNLTYLHNNYIELLAGAGLIGTLLYYLLWAYPLYYFIRFFSLRNKETAVCLVMLILLLTVLDWGRVGYTSKQTYFYLMLFYLQVRVLKKTWLLQCKEKQYEME